jgi:hypothetical protein
VKKKETREKKEMPRDKHVTLQKQYRKCGKPSCGTCRKTVGHGPYWYAYWRDGQKLISFYIGKVNPKSPEMPFIERERGGASGQLTEAANALLANPTLLRA